MHDEILAGGDPADESAAAAEVEVASDDADAAAAEVSAVGDLALSIAAVSDEDEVVDITSADEIGAVADLLASALISGSAQQADAAIHAYNALGREPVAGGPLKAALPEAEEAPVEEEQEQAGLA